MKIRIYVTDGNGNPIDAGWSSTTEIETSIEVTHSRPRIDWNETFASFTNLVREVGDTFRKSWERVSPALQEVLNSFRKVGQKFGRTFFFSGPRPAPVPPGPPPVALDLAAEKVLRTFEPRELGRLSSSRAPARRHERQAVPSRTRRRLRTWERD